MRDRHHLPAIHFTPGNSLLIPHFPLVILSQNKASLVKFGNKLVTHGNSAVLGSLTTIIGCDIS
jgi:hypothetical protein